MINLWGQWKNKLIKTLNKSRKPSQHAVRLVKTARVKWRKSRANALCSMGDVVYGVFFLFGNG